MNRPHIVLRLLYDPAINIPIPDDRESIRNIFDIYISSIFSFLSVSRTQSEIQKFNTFISMLRSHLNVLCMTTSSAAEKVVLNTGECSSRLPDPYTLRQLRLKPLRPSTPSILPLQHTPPAPLPVDPEQKYGGPIPANLWGNKRSLELRANILKITLEAYIDKLEIPSKIKKWAEEKSITVKQYIKEYDPEIIEYILIKLNLNF